MIASAKPKSVIGRPREGMTRSMTARFLRTVYGGPEVRLEKICDRYLSIGRDEAYRQAARCTLPFPAFKLGKSKKSPWLVNIEDLAQVLDQADAEYRELWQRCQV